MRDVRLLLHARRPARRPPRGGVARDPALHREPRAAVPRDRRRQLRQRVPRRPHAAALRALQHRPEVRRRSSTRARGWARRPWRPATTPGWTPAAATARCGSVRGMDPSEGPVLLPVRPHQDQLARAVFPLGRADEDRGARASPAARAARWPTSRTARRSASSRTATTRRSSSAARRAPPAPGAIVDAEGRVLGRHAGVHRFTVGQRKGLGLSSTRAAVRHGDARPTGRRSSSGRSSSSSEANSVASGVNWVAGAPPASPLDGSTAQIRSRHAPARALVRAPRQDGAPRHVRGAAVRHHARAGGGVLRRGRGRGWGMD